MAWLVNAVDITASASTDGVTAATRGSGSGTTSSTVSPTSSSTGMTSVSSTCSPLRSASRSSVAACAANIAPGAPAPGRGVNVPGGNGCPRHERSSRPVSSRNTSSRLRRATCTSSASAPCAAHQPVIDESTAGSIRPCTTYRPASVSAAR